MSQIKQVISKCVHLAYVNTSNESARIDVPFPVGSIVVKEIISLIDPGDDWNTAINGKFFEMKSDLVQGETLGVCGGVYYLIGADHVNLPLKSASNLVYKYNQPMNINKQYNFAIGDTTNNGIPLVPPTAAVFSVILEFHEF